MDIKWNFPHNGCGQVRGVSDAGIETFTGTEIQSLAREICQNSLDAAKKNTTEPVKVEFENYNINSSDIPGYEQYKSNIKKAYDYWKRKNSEKTKTFLTNAFNAINKPRVNVLRISDFNTTGLSHPYEDSDDGWNALTKLDGGATKSGDKAGAFGIGKNAPFTNSDYRLVFYRTLNEKNETAAQGMSRFISFPEDFTNAQTTMTTGIGYYGNPNGNFPVTSIDKLERLYKRSAVGTDVFIYGFNAQGDWHKNVIKEILENFLMSIYKDLLNVTVKNQQINRKTLSSCLSSLSSYNKKPKNSYYYHQVLVREDAKEFKRDFHEMGSLKLRILVDSSMKLNRKVLITRSSGMKLFDLDRISTIISFSGILEMEGQELNEFFREMETPAHDKWLPERHSTNPQLAKKYRKELIDWVKECVQSLGEHSSDDEIEVTGLSGVLQKESDKITQSQDENKESLHDTVESILIQPRSLPNKQKGSFFGSDGDEKSTNHNKGDKKSKNRDIEGRIDKDGKYPATRNLSGTRHRSKKDSHRGNPSPGGPDTIHQKQGGYINEELKNVRIIKNSKDSYKVSFILPRDVKSGNVEIVAVGENGKSNKLAIHSVKALSGCTGVKNGPLGIECSNMRGSEKIQFEIKLLDNRNYAMEVNVYEHN